MPTPITVRQLLAGLQEAVEKDPTYADHSLLYDAWDRENFGGAVEHQFTDEEWADFVDFCSYETTPWLDRFEQWHEISRKEGLSERVKRRVTEQIKPDGE
jgi:hypothetical protein